MLEPSPMTLGGTSSLLARHAHRRSALEAGLESRLDVVDALDAGVLAVRADGVVARANPFATRVLRQGDLVGRPIAEILAPLERLLEPQAGPDARRELVVALPDGAMAVLGFSVSALHDLRRGDHWVFLFQEVSSFRELRVQRDRLIQMAALGDAMPTLLHELRNPLAAVTATLEVLVEDAPDAMREDLYAVLSEVRRMNLGLQGIGGLARTAHAGSNTAIDHAIREACRLLAPNAQRRGVELHAIGQDLPLLALDRGAIAGIVFNLVKNAVEACKDGGNVWIDARLDEGDTFVMSVRDDGVGMSVEVLARCTELFFTTKDMGSGIGLALCRQVAEASGGLLTIESLTQRGTTVTVRVPLQPPRAR